MVTSVAGYIALFLVGLLVLLNLAATYSSIVSYAHEESKRYFQIVFAWMLPYVGAMTVIYFNRETWVGRDVHAGKGSNTSISEEQAISHALDSAIGHGSSGDGT